MDVLIGEPDLGQLNERLRKTKIRSDLVLVKKTFRGSKRRISSLSKGGSRWAILNIAGKINEVSLNDQIWEELDLVVTIPPIDDFCSQGVGSWNFKGNLGIVSHNFLMRGRAAGVYGNTGAPGNRAPGHGSRFNLFELFAIFCTNLNRFKSK